VNILPPKTEEMSTWRVARSPAQAGPPGEMQFRDQRDIAAHDEMFQPLRK
jgi:hypothetical protein